MDLLLMILAAVVVAVIVAIFIVKVLPLKLRWMASLLLLAATVLLCVKIYDGIMLPIKFNEEKVVKYTKVVNRLKIIRDAQLKYHEVNNKYTDDKKELIKFIETAKLALTETRDTIIKVNAGGGIINDVPKKIKDTIGYEPFLKYFKNRDYKNMFTIPGTNGKEFYVEAGTVEKVEGLVVPTFIAKCKKEEILKGMDDSLVKQELEAAATDQIKGRFVSVGSLEEVSTGGNWPPSYDKKERESKKKNKK